MSGSWRGTHNQPLIKALDDGRSIAEVAREMLDIRERAEGPALRERFRREREGVAGLPNARTRRAGERALGGG